MPTVLHDGADVGAGRRVRTPYELFAISATFHYLGPAFAVLLFAHLGVLGVAWFRIAAAALVFAVWRRPWRLWARLTPSQVVPTVALGVVLAVMNTVFYAAIDRLPLATVGTVEFLGVVAVAAAGVRDRRNALALTLAVAGVAALAELRLVSEPLGFAFALANCALFAAYVVLGHRVARSTPATRWGGVDLLATAMLVATVVVMPAGLPPASTALGAPRLILAGVGVGVCSSVVPYVADQLAMARLPRATFALMLAVLPMFATLIGAVVLAQVPTPRDVLGIVLVAAGVAVHRPADN